MPATPKKGRRFGGSSAHHKSMMANLVASLIAAEAITTTEAKAKAYERLKSVHFEGAEYRTDIGYRAVERESS